MEKITSALQNFEPISLEEMDNVKLLNRADTKYLFNKEKLVSVLEKCTAHYRILEISGKRANDYKTLYFDTEKFQLYYEHHRGKMNRRKIRYRKYLDSDLCYLEIKLKTNKGKTEKERIKRKDFENHVAENEFSERAQKFIEETTNIPVAQLQHKLNNYFTRITLVHKHRPERLTIDFNLKYENSVKNVSLQNLVIAELKQEKFSAQSDFVSIMKKEKIYAGGFSKYCFGALLLYPQLKRNSFKPKILFINKLLYGNIAA